jgi:hypothetical protein
METMHVEVSALLRAMPQGIRDQLRVLIQSSDTA